MLCHVIAIIIIILCLHISLLREVTGSSRGGVTGEETGKPAPHAIVRHPVLFVSVGVFHSIQVLQRYSPHVLLQAGLEGRAA